LLKASKAAVGKRQQSLADQKATLTDGTKEPAESTAGAAGRSLGNSARQLLWRNSEFVAPDAAYWLKFNGWKYYE
jgi:hypothetical protein